MPILDNEIVWRPAAMVSDTTPAQNGGRMAFSQLVSGVKNNLFPDVSQSERTSGSTKWRKAFIHVASAQDTALLNVRLFLDAMTPAGDFVVFHPGTQTDTEDQVTSRPYGIGTLHANLAAGATQILVACEHNAEYATLQPFRAGDLVRVSNRSSTGGAGNEEWVTVTNATYGAEYATLDISSALVNAYDTADTLVSSVFELPSVVSSYNDVTVTSAGGTFDSATVGNLSVHNMGAIEESWTLTFTSATDYTVSGMTVGILSSPGSIAADYAPLNPATGTPYFSIQTLAWGGSFAAGDTVTFTTHPAAIPIWYRRQVPAGTFSLANDYCSLAIHGESA
ncbi:hypothetical protein [Sulfurivermis fontis]|uniref:hypothetical protein n=1 Tax=Sulfurivermis fontis TaxID=1972068 RepID=UPI000FD987DC|nr:hypothetical protein [Sulfurivermis fontis]